MNKSIVDLVNNLNSNKDLFDNLVRNNIIDINNLINELIKTSSYESINKLIIGGYTTVDYVIDNVLKSSELSVFNHLVMNLDLITNDSKYHELIRNNLITTKNYSKMYDYIVSRNYKNVDDLIDILVNDNCIFFLQRLVNNVDDNNKDRIFNKLIKDADTFMINYLLVQMDGIYFDKVVDVLCNLDTKAILSMVNKKNINKKIAGNNLNKVLYKLKDINYDDFLEFTKIHKDKFDDVGICMFEDILSKYSLNKIIDFTHVKISSLKDKTEEIIVKSNNIDKIKGSLLKEDINKERIVDLVINTNNLEYIYILSKSIYIKSSDKKKLYNALLNMGDIVYIKRLREDMDIYKEAFDKFEKNKKVL